MPYPAIWTKSQRGQLSADYESVAFPGNTFIFLQKRRTQQCSFFRCAHCAKAMKLRSRRNATRLTVPIVRATLEEGFLDDPDNPFHRHFCIDEEGVDTSTFAAKARYIYNKVKLELLDMPMTPRQAWLQMEAEVIANFPDQQTQVEIIRRLPSDKSAKRSFARRSSLGRRNLVGELANLSGMDEDLLVYVDGDDMDEEEGKALELLKEDTRNIPLELLKPCSDRPAWVCAPGRERLANFFLIYRDCRPNFAPFMVFSDMMGINLLHKCPDIVCDGNSVYYPRGFAQLYTFHAVHHSIPEEAHLCAFALLPNTAPATYIKLFDIISERLLAEYGNHGDVKKNWYFDNQYAAINGCKAIFEEDEVEGSEERTANFAHLWHEHLRALFLVPHPNLVNFIRCMREELTRSSIQAERIFPPPPPITAINLDNIEIVTKLSGLTRPDDEKDLFMDNSYFYPTIYRNSMLDRRRPVKQEDYVAMAREVLFEKPRRGRPRKYPLGMGRATMLQQQKMQIRKMAKLAEAAEQKFHQDRGEEGPSTSAAAGIKAPPSTPAKKAVGMGKQQQRKATNIQRIVVMENGVAEVEQPVVEDEEQQQQTSHRGLQLERNTHIPAVVDNSPQQILEQHELGASTSAAELDDELNVNLVEEMGSSKSSNERQERENALVVGLANLEEGDDDEQKKLSPME